MRYPYEFYAKYLILTKGPGPARERLTLDGCPFQDDDWDALVARLGTIPPVKAPYSKKCLEWAKEQQVYGLLTKPDAEVFKTVFRIFGNCTQRQTLEALTIINVDDEKTLKLFIEGTGVELDEHALKVYQHYMWNPQIMSRLDWFKFLFTLVQSRGGMEQIPNYPNAADLWTFLHIQPELALAKLGYASYARLDKGKALDELFTTAYIKTQEEAAVGNTLGFQKAAGVVISAYEASKTTTTDIGDIIKRLASRVKIANAELKVEMLGTVTDGHHSEIHSVTALLPKETARGKKSGDDDFEGDSTP